MIGQANHNRNDARECYQVVRGLTLDNGKLTVDVNRARPVKPARAAAQMRLAAAFLID
jgi:hypothetical protein